MRDVESTATRQKNKINLGFSSLQKLFWMIDASCQTLSYTFYPSTNSHQADIDRENLPSPDNSAERRDFLLDSKHETKMTESS